MKMIDFEYDGRMASNYGMVVANLTGTNEQLEIGNTIEISEVKATYSDKYFSTGYEYKEPFELEIGLVRNPCSDAVSEWLSETEINEIVRWLNRKSYYKFKPVYDDGSFSDVYFMGTFNVKPWLAGYQVAGMCLTFRANAPYGFIEEKTFKGNGFKIEFYDESDEIGYIYPDVEITLRTAGTLSIYNSLEPDRITQIRNCQNGEKITFHGKTKQITSDSATHAKTLGNDFNFHFPRVVNTFEDQKNTFNLSLDADYVLTYSPVRKVGVIV